MADRWMIFYDDETTFSNEDGLWIDAPTDGVLYVISKRHNSDIVEVSAGNDHYILLDGETVAATQDLGPLLRKWGVKFGRWTSHKMQEKIGNRVAAEAAKWR